MESSVDIAGLVCSVWSNQNKFAPTWDSSPAGPFNVVKLSLALTLMLGKVGLTAGGKSAVAMLVFFPRTAWAALIAAWMFHDRRPTHTHIEIWALRAAGCVRRRCSSSKVPHNLITRFSEEIDRRVQNWTRGQQRLVKYFAQIRSRFIDKRYVFHECFEITEIDSINHCLGIEIRTIPVI